MELPRMAYTSRLHTKGVPFIRLWVFFNGIGVLQVGLYERFGKSLISLFRRAFNSQILNRSTL